MTAKAMLDKNPHPTDAQIRETMNATLCRCMTYYRVQAAIKRAAKTIADARPLRRRRWWHEHLQQIPKQIEEVLTHASQGLSQERGPAGRELRRVRAGPQADAQSRSAPQAAGPYPDPDFRQLDSWIVIHREQHRHVLCRQDRLRPGHRHRLPPVDVRRTRYRLRSRPPASWAARTSPSIRAGRADRPPWREIPGRCGAPPRKRAVCCSKWASARLGVPVDQLAVSDAVITVKADPSKRVTYGELIGGKEVQCHADRQQCQRGHRRSKMKPVQELKYTGQSLQRDDIPAKVDGSLKWAVDVKLPGMVHARNVKPPFACAKLTGIDESSVRESAGLHQGGEQRQLRRGGVRTRRTGHPRRPPAQDDLGEAGNRSVPRLRRSVQLHARAQRPTSTSATRSWWGIPMRHFRARRRSSKPNTRSRSRDTPHSPARMPRRTRRTAR